jgi:hypothetical protein
MNTSSKISSNFYTQTGVVSYLFDIALDSTRSGASVGLRSSSTSFYFTFRSGKIFDWSRRVIGGYSADVPVEISGQVGRGLADCFINGVPAVLGGAAPTGNWTGWFLDPTGVSVDILSSVRGNRPAYSVTTSGEFLGPNTPVYGAITNNSSLPFLLVGTELMSNSSDFRLTSGDSGKTIQPSESGVFALKSDVSGAFGVLPLRISTDFGLIDLNFSVYGNYQNLGNSSVTISPESNLNALLGIYTPVSSFVDNYPNSADFSVELAYVSGTTGNIFGSQRRTQIKTAALSGKISGSGFLESGAVSTIVYFDTGLSGNVSGNGTGVYRSAWVTSVSSVGQTFSVRSTGLGDGSLYGDFSASGKVFSAASGNVGLFGDYSSPRTFFNVSGSGTYPFYYQGVIPVSSGQSFLTYSGIFPLSSIIPQAYISSGLLTKGKLFSGLLYQQYRVTGLGFATGAFQTGKVDSKFNYNFEPGLYIFSKSFSGLVSSSPYTPPELFDPSVCGTQKEIVASGEIFGNFSWPSSKISLLGPSGYNSSVSGDFLDCVSINSLPNIVASGIPSSIFAPDGSVVSHDRVVYFSPSGGFSVNENSSFVGTKRTSISRMGSTPSGYGFFSGIVEDCGHEGVWRESVSYESQLLSGKLRHAKYGEMSCVGFLTESGVTKNSFAKVVIDSEKPMLFLAENYPSLLSRYENLGQTGQTSLSMYPVIELYKNYSGAIAATGSVGWTGRLISGARLFINGYVAKYEPVLGSTGSGVFYDIYSLKSLLNDDLRYKVKAEVDYPDYKSLFLSARVWGVSGNSVTLSGNSGFIFSDSHLTGGIAEGAQVRYLPISENSCWNQGLGMTQSLLEKAKKPLSSCYAAIGTVLTKGEYILKTSYTSPFASGNANSRGFVSFATGEFRTCESWKYLPVEIKRAGGSLGRIYCEISTYERPQDIAEGAGKDYTGDKFYTQLSEGQSGAFVYVPVVDEGDKEVTESLGLSLLAYYENAPEVSAISGQSNAIGYIFDDDFSLSGVCTGSPSFPQPSGVYNPEVTGHPTRAKLCGDSQFFIWNDIMSGYHESPFNFSDNCTTGKLLWFAAQNANDEWFKIEYTQKRFPYISNGFSIDKIIITKGSQEPEVIEPLSGGERLRYTSSLGGFLNTEIKSSNFKDCSYCVLNPSFDYLYMFNEITDEWYNAKRIGGAFYFLMKAASNQASTYNNNSSANYDGISEILYGAGLGSRYRFMSYPDLESVTEAPAQNDINSIIYKWRQFSTAKGSTDVSWDYILTRCGNSVVGLGDGNGGVADSGDNEASLGDTEDNGTLLFGPYSPSPSPLPDFPVAYMGSSNNGGTGGESKPPGKKPKEVTPSESTNVEIEISDIQFAESCFPDDSIQTATVYVNVKVLSAPENATIQISVKGSYGRSQSLSLTSGNDGAVSFDPSVTPGKGTLTYYATAKLNGEIVHEVSKTSDQVPGVCDKCFGGVTEESSPVTIGTAKLCSPDNGVVPVGEGSSYGYDYDGGGGCESCGKLKASLDLRPIQKHDFGKGKNRTLSVYDNKAGLVLGPFTISSTGKVQGMPDSYEVTDCKVHLITVKVACV